MFCNFLEYSQFSVNNTYNKNPLMCKLTFNFFFIIVRNENDKLPNGQGQNWASHHHQQSAL